MWLKRWGILPSAGGLNDQDVAWVRDIELFAAMEDQVEREYMEWKKQNEAANG